GVCLELDGPRLTNAAATATAATAPSTPTALLMKVRVALGLPGPGPGLDSLHGPGACTPGGLRATAGSPSTADRRGRRSRARGTCGVAREAFDQARVEGLGAPARDPHDRPDNAR